MLSHVLEQHGLATVGISLIRKVTVKLRPPRALYCEFPLGRPLGRPGDPAFQHRVLAAALALLDEPGGPVLADFPETIAQDLGHPLACPVPPAADDGEPAVAEALAFAAAYRRSLAARGRTNVGRFAPAAEIPATIARFRLIADGAPADEDSIRPRDLMPAASDVRAYYEEAALALVDHVPEAGQTDAWMFRGTAAGATLLAAWRQLSASALPEADWLYVVPRAFQPPR